MLAKNLYDELIYNNVSTSQAKIIKKQAMGDNDLKRYLPNTKIILNGDINKYKSINQLLPKKIDCVILLFRNSHNRGHWVLLSRYDEATKPSSDVIEYFDPYGYDISHPINWIDENKQKELNEYDHLSSLLNNSNFNIIVNKYAFQNRKDLSIATCGRWCVIRALTILNKKLSLDEFKDAFKKLKKKTRLPYDVIVSDLINYVN